MELNGEQKTPIVNGVEVEFKRAQKMRAPLVESQQKLEYKIPLKLIQAEDIHFEVGSFKKEKERKQTP